jgi:F-box domain
MERQIKGRKLEIILPKLGKDLWLCIFHFVSAEHPDDLFACRLVCSNWRNWIDRRPSLWRAWVSRAINTFLSHNRLPYQGRLRQYLSQTPSATIFAQVTLRKMTSEQAVRFFRLDKEFLWSAAWNMTFETKEYKTYTKTTPLPILDEDRMDKYLVVSPCRRFVSFPWQKRIPICDVVASFRKDLLDIILPFGRAIQITLTNGRMRWPSGMKRFKK